jgi:phospholipid/cholesterol/gamma-HCH transport system ATP-binding protein
MSSAARAEAANGDHVVEVEGLWTRLGGRVVHRDIDLSVRRGEVLSVIGGSGSGKTTLLRALIGLQPPAQGRVRVFGHDLYQADARTQRSIRRRWGVLFQGGALFSAFSAFDNVALPLRELHTLDEATINDIVMARLSAVGLGPPDAPKLPAELSGGMVNRVALARALALDPELVFLDEPTAGLDPVSADSFHRLVSDLRRDLGLTVVMVTHDLDTLDVLSDRVAALAESRLVALGPLAQVQAVDHPFIHEYFASERGRLPSPVAVRRN